MFGARLGEEGEEGVLRGEFVGEVDFELEAGLENDFYGEEFVVVDPGGEGEESFCWVGAGFAEAGEDGVAGGEGCAADRGEGGVGFFGEGLEGV